MCNFLYISLKLTVDNVFPPYKIFWNLQCGLTGIDDELREAD